MTRVRLLPVVVVSISALLVLKTVGLVTHGAYVLGGVTQAQAAGGGGGGEAGGAVVEADATVTLAGEPTMEDTSPLLSDPNPTLGQGSANDHGASVAADHGTPAPAEAHGEETAPHDEGAASAEGHDAGTDETAHTAEASNTFCVESQTTLTEDTVPSAEGGHEAPAEHGEADAETASLAQSLNIDCLPSGDAVPAQVNADGTVTPLTSVDAASLTEQQILGRLAARRTELDQQEQDLALRASIVDAAEKRIEERAATLAALEAQIAALVDQRQEMESGQFAGLVLMYENMKPKDAAAIFNNLEMDVLLRVAKMMTARKMAPILAEMTAERAQELTVRMAALADTPVDQMTPQDLEALPQIVGQ